MPLFNSRDRRYRAPFGAVAEQTAVLFRVCLPRAWHCHAAHLLRCEDVTPYSACEPLPLLGAELLESLQAMGVQPREVLRQLERSHIFTHIRWEMRGLFLEAAECSGGFCWMTEEEITQNAALPTAFRQFWEERNQIL